MNDGNGLLKIFKIIDLILVLGVSMNACSGSKIWQEEVLLHDGGTIVVDRSVEYGGRHEIGQSPPFKEQTLTFTLPNTKEPGSGLALTHFPLPYFSHGTPFTT
ncbi:MAG: hypothetical protein ABIT70_00915 [Sulfuriferula sp.]